MPNKTDSKKNIHDIKKGAFHRWLGKKPGEPITDADIEKGLRSQDPHVRRMAQFAKNSRKWKHGKIKVKKATESFNIIGTIAALEAFNEPGWDHEDWTGGEV